jgi:FkbH-like protein
MEAFQLVHNNFEAIKAKLSQFKTNDYIDCLNNIENEVDIKDLLPLKIAILRSYTVEPLEPVLKLRLILEGCNPQFTYGGYNQFAQEVLDEKSFVYSFKPDLILFLLRFEDLLPEFCEEYNRKSFLEWQQIIKSTAEQIGAYVSHIRKKLDSQIFFQNMCFTHLPYWGVYDSQQTQNQVHLVHEFNQLLINHISLIPNSFVWDYNNFLLRKGYENIFDLKMWYLSKNPFKYSAYPEIIDDLCRYLISAIGKVKKCIVLDLDNTLWGGILGEDGFDRIALGNDYPGNCYQDFQKELLKLYHRGILLAINSKNNEEEVFEVIDKHLAMVLQRKHFAAYRINWNDKATNLDELAQELNIGIDSMIFIDDNPRECELIRQMHPECTVIELSKKVYTIPRTIHSLCNIENINITSEDKKKGEIYQSQIERKKIQKTISNLEDYLKNLEIEISIKKADNFSLPRIAQLTQKTNQMNLTTRRYSESDIRSFMESHYLQVYYVSVKDRLGDQGIVGVIILRIEKGQCMIDTFLLSCRVLGLKIEQSMVVFIQDKAKEMSCKQIIGEYIPTSKNKLAIGFYEKADFKKQSDSYFSLDLKSLNNSFL